MLIRGLGVGDAATLALKVAEQPAGPATLAPRAPAALCVGLRGELEVSAPPVSELGFVWSPAAQPGRGYG
jgi:hypothetical protein